MREMREKDYGKVLRESEFVRAENERALREAEQIRQRYGVLVDRLVELFARHDPQGLVLLGWPRDEYAAEVREILMEVEGVDTEGDFRALLRRVHGRRFGARNLMTEATASKMAREAWRLIQRSMRSRAERPR